MTSREANSDQRWQFWIDRGGTFTDIVARQPDGTLIVHKLLSENPERYQDAAIQGIRELLGVAADAPLPSEQIAAVKMGTTVATNALLERKGDRTVFLTTKGFRDVLRIGYQNRPNIFARQIILPEMLYEQVIEVNERYSAHGEELVAITPAETTRITQALQAAYDNGIRSCAIAFLHGYRYPDHEQQIAAIARAIGFLQISVSHQVSPLMKLVSRGDTTVVDAYLSPILRRYVEQVAGELGGEGRRQEIGEEGERDRADKGVISPHPHPRLMFMQSNGGLTDAHTFQGKDSILSGPAGGIVGAVQTSKMAGFNTIITFDMGGTSTDVAHYAGEYERAFETEVAGVRLRAPMMSIHTVAAGGGSILFFDGARYRVGPESAGANPGPACYRRGGPLTVTDCNVMLGKIQPDFFPAVFGANGDLPLDSAIVQTKFAELAAEIRAKTGDSRTPEQVAEGFLAIAVEKMANAIKKISVQRGYDVTEYTLCCFGGAGGQHACAIANSLGMKQVLIHPYAGVLSAYGMGLANQSVMRERAVEIQLDAAAMTEFARILTELETDGKAELLQQLEPDTPIQTIPRAHLRYEGTDSALIVEFGTVPEMTSRFEQAHLQRYGFIATNKPLVVEAISVEVISESAHLNEPVIMAQRNEPLTPVATRSMYVSDSWQTVPLYQRDALFPGDIISGPAIILEATGTNVIEPGWQARLSDRGHLVLQKSEVRSQELEDREGREDRGDKDDKEDIQHSPTPQSSISSFRLLHPPIPFPLPPPASQLPHPLHSISSSSPSPDPVLLEIFNHLFMAIAEQMGFTLQNTSYSVNIKERLDFSCAIFDRQGQLVANAPHIPVHLGSMGESVQSLIRDRGNAFQPGDVYVLNNPYNGGTHLPDITVITPVFVEVRNQESGGQGAKANSIPSSYDSPTLPSPSSPLFFVASRGHHADIGGITPGSMPPNSCNIDQEGVLINNFQLVEQGQFREAELLELLTSSTYPVRNPAQNLADLKAQVAANTKGVQELQKMVQHFGLEMVQAYMQYVQDNAEASVRRVIERLQDGNFTYEMDDGCQIQVMVSCDRAQRTTKIDFTGTSPQQETNYNAPLSVCKAAVLYVFRTLVDDDIPLNAGCLKPLEIIVPEGCMLNPRYPAAVVAGNVETSQAVTNALYGALGVMAASQGTMNNFTFGNQRYQYYETICGGSGAGATFDGTDAVHTHMTNSRLTDPEVLEWRFPVRLQEFSIRPNSGGLGKYRGGNGVIRRIQFQEAMTAAILSNHRRVAPFGLQGGNAGATGRNWVERSDGTVEELGSKAEVVMQPGDVFVIETPGGGGFGLSDSLLSGC
ncbi:N-methylhydantoinase B/acetone carboxylase, alpha subunit [Leptolyngbyaceae cyanobacterium JSC-12]|nr:N-methylhydantoinase B/acetone carboxylase, alpha subunit [Leptolyngbyaceae cyanobacterium JSC-12]